MRNAFATLVVLVAICWPASPRALEVRVRGSSTMSVRVQGASTITQISGNLIDDMKRGIAHRLLEVEITQGETSATVFEGTTTTDALGQFSLEEELPPGAYNVVVRFRRGEHFDGAEFRGDVQLIPAPFALQVFGPELAVGREQAVFVYLHAMAGEIPVQTAASVSVNDAYVGEVDLDASGRGSFDLRHALQPGQNTVVVRIAGSNFRQPVEAESEVRFAEELVAEAQMEERVERLARGLAIYGLVSDAQGTIEGIRVQAVFEPILRAEGDTRKSVMTSAVSDEGGRFNAFVPWARLGDGDWNGKARFLPAVGKALEVSVEPIRFDTETTRVVVDVVGTSVLILGILVLLGFLARELLIWVEGIRQARARKRRSQEAMAANQMIVPVFLGPDGEESTDKVSHNLAGLTWDVWDQSPLEGTTLRLLGRNDVCLETLSDSGGRFRFQDVPDGEYILEAGAHGFVTGQMRLKIPHKGRLRNFRVDLVAVPLKIRRIYQSLMEEVSGEDPWGRLSPSEIEELLWSAFEGENSSWGSAEEREDFRKQIIESLNSGETPEGPRLVSVMTDIIEESYFSGRVYDESIWLVARSVALKMRASAGLEELR